MVNTDLACVLAGERRQMPSGDHVEVVREEGAAGRAVRYSKRFLLSEAARLLRRTVREAERPARAGEQRVGHVRRRA